MYGLHHHAAPPAHMDCYSHGCYNFDNADMGFGPRDLTAHFPAFLNLRVTNLVRSDQAHQRRMEKAAGRYERKRLRKRLGQQSASSTATSSTLPSATPTDATQHVVSTAHPGRDHAQSSSRLPIGSMPKRPAPVPGQNLCLCVSVCVSVCVPVSWGWQGRAESEKGLSSPVPDQQRSLSLMISFFSTGIQVILGTLLKSIRCRIVNLVHSSTSSAVSSGHFSLAPCALRQSDILNTRNNRVRAARDG